MKIKPINPYESVNRANKATKANSVKKSNGNIKDEVVISKEAKSMEKTIKKAKNSNTDQVDKVDRIKGQVSRNTYKVDSYKVASKIVDSIITNK